MRSKINNTVSKFMKGKADAMEGKSKLRFIREELPPVYVSLCLSPSSSFQPFSMPTWQG